jgi:hypothetical protein
MANFGLKFRFINSNKKCCGQTDPASENATKVYTARCVQAQTKEKSVKLFKLKEFEKLSGIE